jgi:hypothetical protein
LGAYNTLTINELISKCSTEFPKYFKNILSSKAKAEIAENVYKSIRSQITFQALTNDILGYFYEYAILSEDVKDSLGIFWTDQTLAKKVCNSMPFEYIPLKEMRVLDGTCGSGSLLISACDRLQGLLPVRMVGQEKHNYLTSHVMGVEIEQLSSEIAKLSLLLYSLPYGNNWDIINSDFLKVDFPNNPNIIVANPPFKESKTDELASQFLTKYLEVLSPGGIMGIILPASFLESAKAAATRKSLMENCRVLEIWYLPEGAFRTSSIATVVVLLRKNSSCAHQNGYPVKVIELNKQNYGDFINNISKGNVSFVNSAQWYNHNNSKIFTSSFDNVLEKIQADLEIDDVVSIRQGIIPGGNSNDFSDIPLDKENELWVKWLQTPDSNILEPYKVNWKNYKSYSRLYTRYPGNHHRPRLRVPFEEHKIIVNAVRNNSSSWRIYGTIDREGYYVSQGFFVMHLKNNNISLEEVISVINHPIANLFIGKYNRRSYIQKESIGSIPFPKFTIEQKEIVIKIVNEILHLKLNDDEDNGKIRNLIKLLDNIVYDAYKISIQLRSKINSFMNCNIRPGNEWSFSGKPIENGKANKLFNKKNNTWKIYGQIEKIDLNDLSLNMILQNENKSLKIPIPNSIPGWGLECGATFEAEIPFDQRYQNDVTKYTFINFRLLNYGYLSEEELEGKTFARNRFD